MTDSPSSPDRNPLDPLVIHARRETLVILAAFVVCLLWSVGWCYSFGYPQMDGGPISRTLGMPSWAFWGVLLPWLAADLFAVWFCFFFMADDPLGETEDESARDDPTARVEDGPGEDAHA